MGNGKNKLLRNSMIMFWVMVVVFIILIPLGNLPWLENEGHSSYLGAVLTGVSLIGAGISLYIQMLESRKLQEAEFVLNLNQAFVETDDYAMVYEALEYEYFSSPEYIVENGPEKKEALIDSTKPDDIRRIQISNYLTFFESMYLLVQKEALPMNMLNDLFGYRFFLAVHSDLIQREKLVAQPLNFRNIYYLEKKWMEYRKANNLNVFRYENRLEEACKKAGKMDEYNKIMQGYPG